jgi:hypothetical protein
MGLGWIVDGKDGFAAVRWFGLDWLGWVVGMASLWGCYGSPRFGGLESGMGRWQGDLGRRRLMAEHLDRRILVAGR